MPSLMVLLPELVKKPENERCGTGLRLKTESGRTKVLQNPLQADQNPKRIETLPFFTVAAVKRLSKATAAVMTDLFPPLATSQIDAKTKVEEKVDYSNLPYPVPYEEVHREAYSSVSHFLPSSFYECYLSHIVLVETIQYD